MSALAKLICLGMIRTYQWIIAPVLHALFGSSGCCRFTPTCSQYAEEAIRTHGAVKGTWLTFRRLCRCHPWGSHGYDPVPQKKSS